MSAEERWAHRREWEQERGEIEIKNHWVVSREWNAECEICGEVATVGREVGPVERRGGRKFEFCAEHGNDDFALELYQRCFR